MKQYETRPHKRSGICKCGKPSRSPGQHYCLEHHNEANRRYVDRLKARRAQNDSFGIKAIGEHVRGE